MRSLAMDAELPIGQESWSTSTIENGVSLKKVDPSSDGDMYPCLLINDIPIVYLR